MDYFSTALCSITCSPLCPAPAPQQQLWQPCVSRQMVPDGPCSNQGRNEFPPDHFHTRSQVTGTKTLTEITPACSIYPPSTQHGDVAACFLQSHPPSLLLEEESCVLCFWTCFNKPSNQPFMLGAWLIAISWHWQGYCLMWQTNKTHQFVPRKCVQKRWYIYSSNRAPALKKLNIMSMFGINKGKWHLTAWLYVDLISCTSPAKDRHGGLGFFKIIAVVRVSRQNSVLC